MLLEYSSYGHVTRTVTSVISASFLKKKSNAREYVTRGPYIKMVVQFS